MKRAVLAGGITALLLTACNGSAGTSKSVSAPSSSPTPTTSASPAPVALADATQIVHALAAAKLPLAISIVFNASNDPNNLLGRPNGYAGKTAFVDRRIKREPGDELGSVDLGGSVEFFGDKAAAERRKTYITGLQQNGGTLFGNEYEYINGAALLRVSGRLTPTQAAGYEAAFGALLVKA